MKTNVPYLCLLALLTTGVSEAASGSNLFFRASEPAPQVEQPYCNTCANTCCCCNESCLDRSCMNGFFFTADYLYWGVYQEGLDLVGSGNTYPGTIKYVEFDWSSGFRAGLGGQFCDNWVVEAIYTYMRPQGSQKVSNGELFPTWIPQYSGEILAINIDDLLDPITSFAIARTVYDTATANIDFDYNLLDLELRRNIPCSPCFDFEAIAGLEGGMFEQRHQSKFSGLFRYVGNDDVGGDDVPEIIATAPIAVETSQKWKFAGGGIHIGAAGEYRSCCGFLLLASGRFNALYGHYQLNYSGEVSSFGDFTVTQSSVEFPTLLTISELSVKQFYNISGKEKFCDFASNFIGRLGFGFENTCGSAYFRLEAAWEISYWADLAQFRTGLAAQAGLLGQSTEMTPTLQEALLVNSSPTVTNIIARNVTLQGLTVSLQITF